MKRLLSSVLIGLLLVAVPGVVGAADVVRPNLQAVLNTLGPADEVDVIITLSDQFDPATIQDKDKRTRRSKLNKALRNHSTATQRPLLAVLRARNAKNIRPFWIFNGIAARVSAASIPLLARHPGVASIRLDETLSPPATQSGTAATPEWNLATIRAPELWALGHTGTGIVVASMDTGVDAQHPDLAARWRGGANSWFDPHGQNATPQDTGGHGTQVMGVLVGGDAGGTSVGVAPGAQWIAVKIFNNSGTTTLSKIHEGFEWLLDPDGNPDVDDAPDIVNNSWHLQGTENQCNAEFAPDIGALKAAGIAVVFAAGNTGPGSATSVSPSNDPEAVAVGAVDQWLIPSSFSGRGPSACGGAIYPGIAAPGVSVRTADLTFGGIFPNSYVTVTGTSFATPHLSGAMALLLNAMASRGVSVTVTQLESALAATATDIGAPGPDNESGSGLLDVMAAYNWLLENAGTPGAPVAAADSYSVNQGGPLNVPAPGVLANDSGYDASGAVLVSGPSQAASFSLNANGSFSYTHNGTATTSDSFVYQVTNGTETAQATATITVTPNAPPLVAANDGYGVAEGGGLSVPAPGVLANDSGYDASGAVLVSGPSQAASFSLNANGSFSYTHNGGETTGDAFVYRVRNASGTAQATVTITVTPVNDPPTITSTPLLTAAVGQAYSYDVNATDPDSSALSYSLVTAPAGMTINASTGLIAWTPTLGQAGQNNVTARAADSGGLFTTQSFTVTVSAPDLIFQDGFEAGNTSAWTAEQDGEADLNVTAAAARAGSFGLAALIDNTTAMWVRSDTPVNEPRYRARFYFDPNGVTMANGNAFRILAARSGNVNAGVEVVRVEFRRNNNNYQVRGAARNDAGGYANSAWFTITDAWHAIEFDWQAATAAGANNGSLTLWLDGAQVANLANIDNDTLRVESVRLGPLQGLDAGTSGTVYFDDFVSRRTTFIGP